MNIELYKALADRNGWDFSISDNRPYFMKNGNYAIPNENTSLEDKELLASIIAECSNKLKDIILKCWNNNIIVSGPCSGIKEFHESNPISLHIGIMGPEEIIYYMQQTMQSIFPEFNHMVRESKGLIRYDMSYFLQGKELTTEQSDTIFGTFDEQLNILLNEQKGLNK